MLKVFKCLFQINNTLSSKCLMQIIIYLLTAYTNSQKYNKYTHDLQVQTGKKYFFLPHSYLLQEGDDFRELQKTFARKILI